MTNNNTQIGNTGNTAFKSFMEEAMKSGFSQLPKVGEVINGKVIGKENSGLYVDLGVFGTGIIYGREIHEAHDIVKGLKIGDEISAKVVELENEDGLVELSLKAAGYELAWEDILKKKETGEILGVVIKEVNKGGLMADINGVTAFMPVSQLLSEHYPRVDGGDKSRIYQELMKFVGQTFNVRVMDVNKQENKLIISEREAQDNEMRKVLEHYSVGEEVEGEVSGVANFGAFIKFQPKVTGTSIKELEGLVHISEIDWQLIEDPADVMAVGDKIQAKIISLDGDKISLSIKALKKDPWADVENKFKTGDVIHGLVAKVNPFGAFVRLDDDIQGLCHISEFGTEEQMRKTIEQGKEYDFHIQSISKQEHRMALGFGASKAKSEKMTDKGKEEKAEAAESKGSE
jgi:small subunit ribosomal protein S1